MNIDWKVSEKLPYCVEEHIFNKIKGHLIASCGFSRTTRGKYKCSGFTNMTFVFNLETNKWKKILSFPGIPRQGARSIVINDELYCWGGWCYNPLPKSIISKIKKTKWPAKNGCRTFSDGYKLSYDEKSDIWKWTKLIDLPFPLTNFSLSNVGTKIYLFAGSMCNVEYSQLSTIINDIGNKLHVLDVLNNEGWKELSMCPGTSRMSVATVIKDNFLYAIGGIYSNYTWKYGDALDRFVSILDNWKYDIEKKEWSKIADNKYNLSSWSSSNNIVYKNKIILMGSSFRMKSYNDNKIIVNDSLTVIDKKIVAKNYLYEKFIPCQIILTYDVDSNTFEKLKSKTMFPINLPCYQIFDNKIMLSGGELPRCYGSKEYHGHLEINMIGTIN